MNDAADTECIRLSAEVRYRAVGEEGVLVQMRSGRVVVVNEVGLHIVRQLDQQPKTREQLVASMLQEFLTDRTQAEADLQAFLSDLDREQLLENG